MRSGASRALPVGHPVSAAVFILATLLALALTHILTPATAGGALLFEVGEHVASPDVVFGSMPVADFVAGFTANLSDTAKVALSSYATLNCLRTMGPEDKTPTTWEMWESFCTKHGLPDGFKDSAAEHVVCDVDCPAHFTITHGTQVVQRAVDNFFRWKKVSDRAGVLPWAALQRLDSEAEEGEDRLRAQRALRLLQGDVVHKEGEDSGSHGVKLETAFDAFCKEHPAWGDASQSFVFFRDHAKVKALSDDARAKLKVTRIQPSGGLSYTHAPAVLQHNLVTLHSGGEHTEMLNVAKFIVKFFEADKIYDHVVHNEGSPSEAFLEKITQLEPWSRDLESHFFCKWDDDSLSQQMAQIVAKKLEEYGTGLVAEFKVEPAFRDSEHVSFKGEARQEPIGLHAMTLVGHRKERGQHLFLLQNWWRSRQFIEVSADYLAAARAVVTFMKKDVTEIPKEFPTDDNVFCMEAEDLAEEPVVDGGAGTYPQ